MSENHPPVVVITRQKKYKLPPNFFVRGTMIWVRIKVRDRKDELRVSTGFTTESVKSRANAVKRGMEIIAEEREKTHGYKKRSTMPTVAEYFATYKAEFLSVPRTKANIAKYLTSLEAFVAFRGTKDLDALTDTDCKAYITLRRATNSRNNRPYADGSIREECEKIRAFLSKAIGKGKPLAENPWKGVDLPNRSERERVIERDEYAAIVAELKPHAQRYAYLVFNSGLRRREYTFLRCCDIRRRGTGAMIHVSTETAKGHKSREVPINATILAVLDAQREHRGLSVKSTERLWPYAPEWFNRLISDAAKKLGLERTTGHDIRRTWATELCNTVAVPDLGMLLGHAKGSPVTLRVYALAKKRRATQQLLEAPTLFAPCTPTP